MHAGVSDELPVAISADSRERNISGGLNVRHIQIDREMVQSCSLQLEEVVRVGEA